MDDQLGHALSNAFSKTILHFCSNLRIVVLQRPFVFLGIVHIATFLHLTMAGISALLNLLLQFLELTLKMCVTMFNPYLSIYPSGK